MISKHRTLLVLSAAFAMGACTATQDLSTGPTAVDVTKARIRVVNATSTPFDVTLNGTVFLGGGNIGIGASACAAVDPTSPSLGFNTVATSTTASVPLPGLTLPALSLTANSDYQLIIYPVGSTPTAALLDITAYTPADTTSMGVRVFNGAGQTTTSPGSIDLHLLQAGTTAISASTKIIGPVAVGAVSGYVDVARPKYVVRLSRTGTTTSVNYSAITNTAATASGNVAFSSDSVRVLQGSFSTIVVGQPSTATSTTMRAFMVGGC